MINKCYYSVTGALLIISVQASAMTYLATSNNFVATLAAVKAGDTIKLNGNFTSFNVVDHSWSKLVTIDATNARIYDTVSIKNVTNLAIVGGTFGSSTGPTRSTRAIAVYDGAGVSVSKATFVGDGTGMGLTFAGTSHATSSANKFSNFKVGLGVVGVTTGKMSSNSFKSMTSDGMNIVGSYGVTAASNNCSGFTPAPLAHPDCIQLWSVPGTPVQSDIQLLNNIINGPSQGLTSFNPEYGGGLRITISGNKINTSYPQGIACYNCVDSVITNNTLTTLPGAAFRTSINIVGGSNNIISGNSVGARPATSGLSAFDTSVADPADPTTWDTDPLPDAVVEDLAILNGDPALDGLMDGAVDYAGDTPSDPDTLTPAFGSARSFGGPSFIGAVPEASIWVQLIAGFGLTGLVLRRPRRLA